ncbi:hypothetical protein D3C76_470240 [compost metagenome]
MGLGAQQGQGFLARRHRADVHAPGAALLYQHLAAGVVVVHHQYPSVAQRAVEVGGWLFKARRVQRQGQPQGVAHAAAALDAEFALHQADQLLGDDQPEVAAQLVAGEEVVAVQLGLQQRFALGGGQRFAAVLHGNAQTRGRAALVERHHQQDLALVGVFKSIFQQARQRLAQACRVATDHPWHLRLGKADQLDVLLLGLGPEDVQAVLDQGVEVELHIVQLDLP